MQRAKNTNLLVISISLFFVLACSATSNLLSKEPTATPTQPPTLTLAPILPTQDNSTATPSGPVSGEESINPIDGLTVIYIPHGSFTMGSETNYTRRKGFCLTPRHKVTLDEYWMDKTEVTVAAFRKFVSDTSYVTDGEKNGNAGWIWSYSINDWKKVDSPDSGPNWKRPLGGKHDPTGIEDHPVTQISWYDAAAYCEWTGGRLPTEAEWERGARGDKDARAYPWGGDQMLGNLLNFGEKSFKCRLCDVHINDNYQYTAPVGTFPAGASPFGLLDMAGNVYEWVQDSYDGNSCYSPSPVTNPIAPEGGKERIMRGGSYADYDGLYWKLRVDNRWSRLPGSSFGDVGIRCVYDQQP